MTMEWPSVLAIALANLSLTGLVLWLFKSLVTTRLLAGVKHEYDGKLELLKAELRENEESFKNELRKKGTQIEAIRNGALAGASHRQSLIAERELKAVDQIWEAVSDLSPAKVISDWLSVVKFEPSVGLAAKNENFRDIFVQLHKNSPLRPGEPNLARRARLYLSPMAWAYFSTYQAILAHSILKLNVLKSGLDNIDLIDTKKVLDLAKETLPHQARFLDQYGPDSIHLLVDELEEKIFNALKDMLNESSSDAQSMERAARIIQMSEDIINAQIKAEAKSAVAG